jgi:hypothetical protein
METFQIYLLKSVAALSFLYIFYWVLFKNETYYSWNRLFLLVSLIIALICPIFNFSIKSIYAGPLNILEPVMVNKYLPATEPSKALSILSIIYISGAVFFGLRLLLSLAKIRFLYYRFPKCEYHGFKAVLLDSDQSPFTFFNILFISRNDYEQGKIDEMMAHERAHKTQFHSIDIVLLEVMTIIQWFNPFVWMFRYSLKSEQEFVADSKVLQEGFDKVKYQKLLFEKSLGITSFNLTNNFNYSLLKKRLKMMTHSKSGSSIKVKYLLSMPILLVTVMLLAVNFNSFGQKEKIYTEVDEQAKYKNGMEDAFKFIQQNITYPKLARDKNLEAKIYVQFVVNEQGKVTDVQIARSDISHISGNKEPVVVVKGYKSHNKTDPNSDAVAALEDEAVRVIKLLEGFIPAKKDGKNVNSQLTIPIVFALEEKKG